MPRGNWIYETGRPSGTTPFIPSDAPPVTIDGAEVEELYDGQFEVRVAWTPHPDSTADNYKGVQVWLEDPDISATTATPMNDTVPMDGSNQMAGFWKPQYLTDDAESPATLLINGKPRQRFIRVYLLAFANVTNATLVRASSEDPPPTPNIQITIPASAGKYVLGQEYAWLITDPTAVVIEDFENPDGPKYSIRFGYTKPDPGIPLPPGLNPFGGVRIVYEYSDGRQAQATFLEVDKPDTWVSDLYDAQTIQFRVYFCSVDILGRANTPVLHVTPSLLIDVIYPRPGQGTTPDVVDFRAENGRHEWQPDGTIFLRYDLKWTPPNSRLFAGVAFFVTNQPGDSFEIGRAGNNVRSLTVDIINFPTVTTTWEIAAISIDFNGKFSDDPNNIQVHTPRVLVSAGPPGAGGSGSEYAPQVGISGTIITTEQELNSDGVVMMRHKIANWQNSTDTKFGGVSIARVAADSIIDPVYWDVPKTATSFVTPWEPSPSARTWDFYFVSRNPQEQRNSILPGITPRIRHSFSPMPGNVLATRLPTGWWNPAEFEWPAGAQFQAKQFLSEKIYVGSILRVGGGSGSAASSFQGNQNGQIVVYNRSNVMRAWMGEHLTDGTPGQPTPQAIWGGWFGELYIGGDNPTNSPIYANNQGTVIVGGFDVQGARYPSISIRREDGVEVGRIGARIGQGLVPPSDPAYIAGAWFTEFALGGQSLADWRILARRSVGSDLSETSLVNLRNINLFTIDYRQNSPNPLNQPNAAMHLEFGYDAFVTDSAQAGYYRFPGITLMRSGTSHGVTIINRGIVLSASSGRRGAFVTFNGQQNGADFPDNFFTVLTMNSPTNQQVNVELGSGDTVRGSAYFRLFDQFSTLNFNVDQNGNVYIRGDLDLRGRYLNKLQVLGEIWADSIWSAGRGQQWITSGGQFIGGGGVFTLGQIDCMGSSNAGSFWLKQLGNPAGANRQVITNEGLFMGSGGVNTAGEIHGSSFFCGATLVIAADGQFKGGSVATQFVATPSNGSVTAGRYFLQWTASEVRAGVSNSFITADGKTVVVSGGIITSVS